MLKKIIVKTVNSFKDLWSNYRTAGHPLLGKVVLMLASKKSCLVSWLVLVFICCLLWQENLGAFRKSQHSSWHGLRSSGQESPFPHHLWCSHPTGNQTHFLAGGYGLWCSFSEIVTSCAFEVTWIAYRWPWVLSLQTPCVLGLLGFWVHQRPLALGKLLNSALHCFSADKLG